MTLTAATILLYLVALSLTVAALWSISDPTRTTKETAARDLLVLIIVAVPFVMLIYFGVAFIISDIISAGAVLPKEEELSSSECLVAAVSYVGLFGWLCWRWRNLIAPSTGVLGPAIIAAAIILITVSVVSAAHHDHTFSAQTILGVR